MSIIILVFSLAVDAPTGGESQVSENNIKSSSHVFCSQGEEETQRDRATNEPFTLKYLINVQTKQTCSEG